MTPSAPPSTDARIAWQVAGLFFGFLGTAFPPLWVLAAICFYRYFSLVNQKPGQR